METVNSGPKRRATIIAEIRRKVNDFYELYT